MRGESADRPEKSLNHSPIFSLRFKMSKESQDAAPAAGEAGGLGERQRAVPEKDAEKPAPSGSEPAQADDLLDDGLVIVDDAPLVDQERINEERKAYLEEARSQEAFD